VPLVPRLGGLQDIRGASVIPQIEESVATMKGSYRLGKTSAAVPTPTTTYPQASLRGVPANFVARYTSKLCRRVCVTVNTSTEVLCSARKQALQ